MRSLKPHLRPRPLSAPRRPGLARGQVVLAPVTLPALLRAGKRAPTFATEISGMLEGPEAGAVLASGLVVVFASAGPGCVPY